MNPYEIEYRSKLVSLEEALDSLKDGDIIGTSQCANEPTAFFDAMDTLRGKGIKVSYVRAHVLSAPRIYVQPHLSGHF